MNMRGITLFAASAALVLAMAACSKTSSSTVAGGGGSSSTSATTVQLGTSATLGQVLTNSSGRTLYLFEQDSGTTSACTGTCASTWPALTVTGQPTAASGLTASMLGTAMRADGSTQVTYNGHPLYVYSGDSAPGQTNGEGISGVWFAVGASGMKVTPTAASSGGGGYSRY
jgi:predicted lipoprotein with Yx(FWY)xxD motif